MKNITEDVADYKVSTTVESLNWQNKAFSKPNAHIRLATVFSGIGAVEQASLE